MLTYSLEQIKEPMYLYLYKCIKQDILSGVLKPKEKLPSKRSFAENNGISTITIQNAYDQLISEGYIYALPKKGYFVADIEGMMVKTAKHDIDLNIKIPDKKDYICDFSSNGIHSDSFPFSVWARMLRDVISNKKEELLQVSPTAGVRELREAIAMHLQSFRGMVVDPNQIVIGAGTEYLYGMITDLIGRDKTYAIENPGYRKLEQIYKSRGIACRFVNIDEGGVTSEGLEESKAQVAHICPNHHYPTGITMTASRRYEILGWANQVEGRYIVEDDYDSEFRIAGKPIPTLFSIDGCEKVIYMNTFSKSLTPTIRISYMVLPIHLANLFYEKMSMYSCTVSNFEQYALAKFISEGYFEKHINRMRLYYKKKRKSVMDIIKESKCCEILENDAGLHFVIKIDTKYSDEELKKKLEEKGV
ncbi:MAG: PLP-dependent aminotransferase family protein, partial [Lachnospiraceae bacterium]|nr:PLP-dependent aminotransferase family protein [Lachnospiraceae bacterium]